jgi:hypothetical protein
VPLPAQPEEATLEGDPGDRGRRRWATGEERAGAAGLEHPGGIRAVHDLRQPSELGDAAQVAAEDDAPDQPGADDDDREQTDAE